MSKSDLFWISNLHIGQGMYFGVKLRTFQGVFISVWFGVGQVQKTELSSYLKTLRLSVGGGAMFNASLVILVPRGIQFSVLFGSLYGMF